MLKRPYYLLLLIPISLGLIAFTWRISNQPKEKALMEVMMNVLRFGHFNDQPVDDQFSSKAFELYINRLDGNKVFFLQDDYQKLAEWRNKIDDEIRLGSYDFFELSDKLIAQRLEEVKPVYSKILETPFDFSADEYLELDGDKRVFPANENERYEIWRKSLKYQVLIRLQELLSQQEKLSTTKDTVIVLKSKEEFEKEARESVKKRYDEYFTRLDKVSREDRLGLYINSITNVFDPHTEYYPPKDKENFDIMISGKLEGIGATLQEKDGYIKVVRIVPGSASWKQGGLKAGDLILKVAQGDQEPKDVVDMRLDEAVQLVRGKKGTEVRLTVKKLDGSIVVIPIIRDVVIIEETYARSAVLNSSESKKKYGYINLPSFYTDFSDPRGRTSSSDVLEEIEKLKREGIDAMVIDLRNNGGGSLPDVVRMAGFFFPRGPVVQVKSRTGTPEVLEDTDPRTNYGGPLLIMVNELSASASEILAAAMQDYGRAIIVGSPSTFGKGTVQRFFELDQMLNPSLEELKPLGSLKITTQKFYRINGGATQLKGVNPDITLPDIYQYIDFGEKELDHPMPWTKINPMNYTKWSTTYNLGVLRKKSTGRLVKDEAFKLVSENALRLKKQRDNSVATLNLDKYIKEQAKLQEFNTRYEEVMKKQRGIGVSTLTSDLSFIAADTSRSERYKEWVNELSKDIYLKEVVNILNDAL
jgi:carboxyl-terminal processing protease